MVLAIIDTVALFSIFHPSILQRRFGVYYILGLTPEVLRLQYKLDYLLEILEANINKGIEHHLLLPEKYSLHKLIGKYKGYWEYHIEPDWLLVYYLDDEVLRLSVQVHITIFLSDKR